ncbi:MAG TPA: hypothetical protein VEX43_08125 [Chthoniobacterales bacterium]|nr:hypothetical protein [Chthoniobacterales bacterium]
MKTLRILLRSLLAISLIAAASAQPIRELIQRPSFRLYTVVLGITVDERGKITRFRVARVADAKSDSKALLPVKVPERFVAAARKKAEAHHYKPRLENGKPVEFFTYYFYAPDYPNALISDLYLPPENQP